MTGKRGAGGNKEVDSGLAIVKEEEERGAKIEREQRKD